jgi:hypothetical protein
LQVREETNELCQTLEASEGKAWTASEIADILYKGSFFRGAEHLQKRFYISKD